MWDGDTLVDVIFRPKGLTVDDGMFARAETIDVSAMWLEVISLEDLLHSKLAAMNEHSVDYSSVLEIGRALREQVDWRLLAERTAGNPFAAGYLELVEKLGIAPIRRDR